MGVSLKAARVNAGYTQDEAAKQLGISVSTISNYERGKTEPDYSVIVEMVRLYKLPFDDIYFSPRLPLNGNFANKTA